jgi:hypothetical protein
MCTIRSKIVKARKAHKCDNCGRTISPKSRYLYMVGKNDWSGGLSAVKWCARCARTEDD